MFGLACSEQPAQSCKRHGAKSEPSRKHTGTYLMLSPRGFLRPFIAGCLEGIPRGAHF
jgi:hypothetical protein